MPFLHPKALWSLLKRVLAGWSADRASDQAASLAFYTMLSIAPLLIICMKIAGVLFGDEAANDRIAGYLEQTIGDRGALAAEAIIEHASDEKGGAAATAISVVVLLLSASGVFRELKEAMNTVWNLPPSARRGVVAEIRARFLSVSMVVGAVFLLLVSLIASALLAGVTKVIGLEAGLLLGTLNLLVSFGGVTLLFALIFRYVPDARPQWRDVWIGATVTAVLFTLGKTLLGWYLGRATTTSLYGAAGSLVAMLIWVYYSAQILLFGAEFTQAWAHRRGREIGPRTVPTARAASSPAGPRIDNVNTRTLR